MHVDPRGISILESAAINKTDRNRYSNEVEISNQWPKFP